MRLADEQIVKIFKEYINNPKMQYAILLNGNWGSGKTYFIKKKFIKKSKSILYISLYGIKNKDEITKKIYYAIIENNSETSKIVNKKIIDKTKQTSKVLGKTVGEISNEIIKKVFNINLSILNNIDIVGVISLFKDISNYTIVFDDLERCDIEINEVLGYINDYVEHKKVKCIIVANETEIEKINYDNNYELKILSCLNNNVEYNEIEDESNNKFKDISNSKIDIKKIQERIEKLYEGNKKYKIIKEKLIGITIEYVPDISKTYNELIENYETTNKQLYNFFKKYKIDFIDIMELNNCTNIRTIIFLLDKFEKIFLALKNKKMNSKKGLIMELIFKNVIFSSIGLKEGVKIGSILAGAMCSNATSLRDDFHQSTANYFVSFDFVNDYVENGKLDNTKINKTINYYFKLNYESLNKSDPYYKLENYWELEDDEIKEDLTEILKNVEENKYNCQLFPKIIYTLSCIENLDFEVKKIKEIINSMGKYIENSSIEDIDFHVFARDEKILTIYNNNIKIIKEKMGINKKNKKEKNIEKILESENWGIELLQYLKEHQVEYLNRKEFLNEFNMTDIIKKIINSNSKNIYNFKYCIDLIYNSSNLKDDYSIDLDNLKELIKGLEEIGKKSFGVTKKEAIEYLSEILKEKKGILEK